MIQDITPEARRRTIIVVCAECKQTNVIKVHQADWTAWKAGKLVQEAFYYLEPGERELLISRTCGSCFDKLFDDV